jgi:hypothetical protein
MKKFIKIITIFLSIYLLYKAVLLLLVWQALPETRSTTSIRPYEAGKPRIIFAGASNLIYNFDYDRIEERFPGFTVTGGLFTEPSGVFVIIDKIKEMKPAPDDIIIMCLPHSLYQSVQFMQLNDTLTLRVATRKTLIEALRFNPIYTLRSIANIDVRHVPGIAKWIKGSKRSQRKTPKAVPGHSPDKFGGGQKDPLFLECWTNPSDVFHVGSNDFDRRYLASLFKSIHGYISCRVMFRFPAVQRDNFSLNMDRIRYLQENQRFLNTFEESQFSREYWFNQWYHLNRCGRDLNTEMLIKELEDLILGER